MMTLTAAEIIAQVMGPLYVILALGMLINTESYRRMVAAFFNSQALCYLGGIVALAAGLLIIAFHYDWSNVFAGLITLLGWLAVAEGALLLITPKALERISGALAGSILATRLCALVALVLGLFLSTKGFRLL